MKVSLGRPSFQARDVVLTEPYVVIGTYSDVGR